MPESTEEVRSIFRQEALDEFSSRMRGEVIRLPSIKLRWLLALGFFWLLCVAALIGFLEWQEPLLVRGRLQSAIHNGTATVTFLLPADVAARLSNNVSLMVGEQSVAIINTRLETSQFSKSWWIHFLEWLRHDEFVCWTADADVSFVSEGIRRNKNAYQLRIISGTPLDVMLLKSASISSSITKNQ